MLLLWKVMIDAFHVGNSSLSEEGSSCALEETAAGLTFYTDRKMIIRRDAWIYIYKINLLISVDHITWLSLSR